MSDKTDSRTPEDKTIYKEVSAKNGDRLICENNGNAISSKKFVQNIIFHV